jgi:hypothetical protein
MAFQGQNNLVFTHKKLKAGDYTIRPFEVNKLWNISSIEPEVEYYKNFGINVYRAFYPENHKYFGNVANISSSLYERVFTTQSLDPKILWYYLDHNYYTEYDKNKQPSFITDDSQITYIAESASLFVIPVGVFGEGIKKKSVNLINYNSDSNYQYTLIDDGLGNLRDTTFDETKIVNVEKCMMYVGFNEKYREYNMPNNKLDYVLDSTMYRNKIDLYNKKNINYIPGIPINSTNTPTGVAAQLSGSYFRVTGKTNFNFNKNSNFAFSFWMKKNSNQPDGIGGKNYLFNKNFVRKVYNVDTVIGSNTYGNHKFEEVERENNQFPFDISYNNHLSSNNGRISFRQSSMFDNVEVVSSVLSSDTWYHVLCQKSGSKYQIWLNGTLDAEVSKTITNDVGNEDVFFIGGSTNPLSNFHGTLDEIRVYGSAISDEQIPYLADNSLQAGYAYQTSRVGNVFYGTGFMVISDPRPKYSNAFLGSTGNFDYDGITNGFRGGFRSTTTFYEYEIICKIRRKEFNFTQNPSIRTDKASPVSGIENYVTSSFFNPYITSVGLYDDSDNLLAIAKLANPLEKRDDVDMNIIVRFDM